MKFFNEKKRFGFITGEDGTDYFVHEADVLDGAQPLRKGQLVQFTESMNPRGKQAKTVRRIEVGAGGARRNAEPPKMASPPQRPVRSTQSHLTFRPLEALKSSASSQSLAERLGRYVGLIHVAGNTSLFTQGAELRRSKDFRDATIELFDVALGKTSGVPAIVTDLAGLLATSGITTDPALTRVLAGIEERLEPLFRLVVPQARLDTQKAVLALFRQSVRRSLASPVARGPDDPPPPPAPPPAATSTLPSETVAAPEVPKSSSGSQVILIDQVAALRRDAARRRLERVRALGQQLDIAIRKFEGAPFDYGPSALLGRTLIDMAEEAASARAPLSEFLATTEELASEHRRVLEAVERAIGQTAVSTLPAEFVDQLARPNGAQRAARLARAMKTVGEIGLSWLTARWFGDVTDGLQRFNILLANTQFQDEASEFAAWVTTLPEDSRRLLARCGQVPKDKPLLDELKAELDRLLETERDRGERRARIGAIVDFIGDPLRRRLEAERSAESEALLVRTEGLVSRLQSLSESLGNPVLEKLKERLRQWPTDPSFPAILEDVEGAVQALGEDARSQADLETLTRLARRFRDATTSKGVSAVSRAPQVARQSVSFAHPLSRGKANYAADLAWIKQPGAPYGVVRLPIRLKFEPPMERDGEWLVESSCDLLSTVPEEWKRQFPATRTFVMHAGSSSRDFEVELPLSVQTADLISSQNRHVSVTLTATRGFSQGEATLSWQGLRRELPAYQPPFSQTVSKREMELLPLGVENQFNGLKDLVSHGRKSFRVHGPRRMGKTTLVRALVEQFSTSTEVVVFPSIVAAEHRGPQDLWEEVSRRLSARFNRPVAVGKGMVPTEGAFDAIREEARRQGVSAIYILIDEAQALFSASGDPHRLGEALKSRLELEWGTRTDSRAALLLGLVGQAHLPDLMGGNLLGAISDSFTTDAIREEELLPLLRANTDIGLQSTKEAREALARQSGNLFILERLLARVAEICRNQGRPWFFEEDVEAAVQRLADADRDRTETTSWSYVRDVLNESDDKNVWRPADTFPVAMAWAVVREIDPKASGASRDEKLENILSILHGWCAGLSLRKDRVDEAFTLLQRQRVLRRDDSFELPVLERLLRVRAIDQDPFADEVERRALTRLGLMRLVSPASEGGESSGGQASVYRATYAGKPAAVRKVRLGTAKAEQRFVREVTLLERLRDAGGPLALSAQPHLPRLFACGVDSGAADTGLVIYEWVDGSPLADIDLSADGAVLVLLGLARALEALAGAAILHRDIRPANILIRQGKLDPVLIDFGLSVAVDEISKSTALGGVIEYLPPEVVEAGPTAWSLAGDLFSVGRSVESRLSKAAQGDGLLTALLARITARDAGQRPALGHVIGELDSIATDRQVRQRVEAVRQHFIAALAGLPPEIREPASNSAGDFIASRSGIAAPRIRLVQVSEFLENLVQAKILKDHAPTVQAIKAAKMGTFLRALSVIGTVPPSLKPLVTVEARAVGQLRNASAHPTELERKLQDALRELPRQAKDHVTQDDRARTRLLEDAARRVGRDVAALLARPEVGKLVHQWLSD